MHSLHLGQGPFVKRRQQKSKYTEKSSLKLVQKSSQAQLHASQQNSYPQDVVYTIQETLNLYTHLKLVACLLEVKQDSKRQS